MLHLVPAFADGRLLDVVSAVAAGTHVPLPLDGMGAGNHPGINIDGFLNYADRPAGGRQSYAQFFRSGAIEGVGNLSKRDADGNCRRSMRGFPYMRFCRYAMSPNASIATVPTVRAGRMRVL